MSPEEEEKILAQAEQWIKYLPQFTQDDVKKLLWPIPRYPNGLMNFHDVQNELAAARERHVLKLTGSCEWLWQRAGCWWAVMGKVAA